MTLKLNGEQIKQAISSWLLMHMNIEMPIHCMEIYFDMWDTTGTPYLIHSNLAVQLKPTTIREDTK